MLSYQYTDIFGVSFVFCRLFSLFFLGGEVIHGFAFALIIGVFIGTYSSIYVSSSALVVMNICKQDFLEMAKDDSPVDDLP